MQVGAEVQMELVQASLVLVLTPVPVSGLELEQQRPGRAEQHDAHCPRRSLRANGRGVGAGSG